MSRDEEEELKVLEKTQTVISDQVLQVDEPKELSNSKKMVVVILTLLVLLLAVMVSNHYYNQKKEVASILFTQLSSPSSPPRDTINDQIHQNLQMANQTVSKQQSNSKLFTVPKNLWVYVEQGSKQTLFVERCLENINFYSNESGFTVSRINEDNFHLWVSQQRKKNIQEIISSLKQRLHDKKMLKKIKQQLISFSILHEKGGVLTSKNLIFTENFTWMEQISSNVYVNRASRKSLPQYVGFFDINKGSIMEKVNKEGAAHQYEKHMIRFPGVDPNFFAAVANGSFLENVLLEYARLMQNPQYLKSIMDTFALKMGTIHQQDIYQQAFTIACHIVLQIKQFQIDKEFQDRTKVNRFAIDQFGLLTINNRYFMQKIMNILDNIFANKIYRNLAIYSLAEVEQTLGPLRYICGVAYERQFNENLEGLVKGTRPLIHPHSFVAKYLFLGKAEYQKYMMKEIEKPMVNLTAKRWDSLPKILWLFWNKGLKKATIGNLLCIENLKRSAEQSGFEVREINNTNIEYYIGKDLNERFDRVIKNRKIPTFPQTKSNFVRKAIVHKYGGIYLDVSYFALESFDWILNIAQYPSEYIFNRYGELPKMLMFFHPHYGQPFRWQYDARANTKRMDLSAYENNLIIAEPNHELLSEWIDEYALTITSDYKDTKLRMEKYHVKEHSWTNDNELYLTSMDSLKNVVGRRQNELDEKAKNKDYFGPVSANQYYGIWSMSGYRGQQKIRGNTNFDNSYYYNPQSSDNVFLYRFSQDYVEGILGKAHQLIKLYGWNIRHLTELMDRDFESGFSTEVHPDSYCMKYLLASVKHRIQKNVEILRLKYQ